MNNLNSSVKMASLENILKPDQLLPKQVVVVKSAYSHLYRIGLCVPTDDSSVKRRFIQKPFFILTLLIIETYKLIVFAAIPEGEAQLFRKYFGDIGEMSGMGNFCQTHNRVIDLLHVLFDGNPLLESQERRESNIPSGVQNDGGFGSSENCWTHR